MKRAEKRTKGTNIINIQNDNSSFFDMKEIDVSGWDHHEWKKKDKWVKLEGNLDLKNFSNLKIVRASCNNLSTVNLSSCVNIEQIYIFNNCKTELEIILGDLRKIKILHIWNNNFLKINWETVYKNTSLEELSVSNNGIFIDLKNIKNLNYLKTLYIGNDDNSKKKNWINIREIVFLKDLELDILQIEGLGIPDDFDLSSLKAKKIICWQNKNKEKLINCLGLSEEEFEEFNKKEKPLPIILEDIISSRINTTGNNSIRDKEKRIKTLSICFNNYENASPLDNSKRLNQLNRLMLDLKITVNQLNQKNMSKMTERFLLEKIRDFSTKLSNYYNYWQTYTINSGGGNNELIEKLSLNYIKEQERKISIARWSARGLSIFASISANISNSFGYRKLVTCFTAVSGASPVIDALSSLLDPSDLRNVSNILRSESKGISDVYASFLRELYQIYSDKNLKLDLETISEIRKILKNHYLIDENDLFLEEELLETQKRFWDVNIIVSNWRENLNLIIKTSLEADIIFKTLSGKILYNSNDDDFENNETFINSPFLSKEEIYSKESSNIKVFLGGTVKNTSWREKLISKLHKNIDFFDPTVEIWDNEAIEKEKIEKEICDILLFYICDNSIFSLYELIVYSLDPRKNVIFCFQLEEKNEHETKTLNLISNELKSKGSIVFDDLDKIADYINNSSSNNLILQNQIIS